ncbi:hypothetical protein OIO90_005716 [Microbotryomycetes sp. JL221]|nr:hypothetical protein OIO90_005716 [Microbotryomycetes sp. JL221]
MTLPGTRMTPGLALELRLRYIETLLKPLPSAQEDERLVNDASILRRIADVNERLTAVLQSDRSTEAIRRIVSDYDLNEPLLRPTALQIPAQPQPPAPEDLTLASKVALLADAEQDILQLDKDLRHVQVYDEKDVVGAGILAYLIPVRDVRDMA